MVQKLGRGGNEGGEGKEEEEEEEKEEDEEEDEEDEEDEKDEEEEEDEASLSKISSEETLSKLRLKLNQNKAKSTKHAGRLADYISVKSNKKKNNNKINLFPKQCGHTMGFLR